LSNLSKIWGAYFIDTILSFVIIPHFILSRKAKNFTL
jgi:hypothetical protein